MTPEDEAKIRAEARAEAFKEFDVDGRLKAVESKVELIRTAAESTAKWIGRAVLGGIVWLATEIADKIPPSWWPK